MTLEIRLFGTSEITINNEPVMESLSTKAQAILYYLAMTGQPQTRAALASLLWGDVTEASARTNLRKALAELRRVMHSYMEIGRQLVAFSSVSDLWIDVTTFENGLKASDMAGLQNAVELYRGDLLAGFYVRNAPDFEAWSLAEQARLRESAIHALHSLAAQYADQGDFAEGIVCMRRLLMLEPWREEAHRQLMQFLAQDGQRSPALTQYETCRAVLAEELGVEPSAETMSLYERIRNDELGRGAGEQRGTRVEGQGGFDSPLPLSPPFPLLNLPAQSTPFIGRDANLAEVIWLLCDESTCRLLTLVGVGGIGKTRFAVRVAQRIIERPEPKLLFDQGIIYVPLTPVDTTNGIESAIASAANFTFYSDVSPRQQLLDFLREKRYLLILDNFEHLLKGAELISELLATALNTKILITSREALNLQEEWLYPVEGLPYPQGLTDDGKPSDTYDAVQLFVQRARRMKPTFSLTEAQPAVVRICQLVEGMPLGIELAASWLKMLSAEKIVAEIETSLDILSTRLQNVPERHRSMRAVFEHSWQLLTNTEQNVLMQFAVFCGGFRQEAAEQVTGASFMTLAILVEKSLLKVTEQGRYHIHELLRQFALEKLTDSQREDPVRDKHSGYYLTYVNMREVMITSKVQRIGLDEIREEIDNIYAGWHWAVKQGAIAIIEQAVEGLYHFHYIRARFQEGIDLFEAALTQYRPMLEFTDTLNNARLLARIAVRTGALHMLRGDFDTAADLLQFSLDTTDDEREQSFALRRLGEISMWQLDKDQAKYLIRKSLALSEKVGDQIGVARALRRLCETASHRGDYLEARRLAEKSLEIIQQTGRPDWIADSLGMLAWTENCLGNYVEAEALYQEFLAISKDIGDRAGVALALEFIAWSMYCIGQASLTDVVRHYEDAITIFREIGHGPHLSMCLADLALAEMDRGEYERAKQACQEGLAIGKAMRNVDRISYNLSCLGAVASRLGEFTASRAYLSDALSIAWGARKLDSVMNTIYFFAVLLADEAARTEPAKANSLELLAFVINHPAIWQPFRDRALRFQAELIEGLSHDVIEAAYKRGQAMSLEEAIAILLVDMDMVNNPYT